MIENNLVYNTERGCFSQHYGRENTVRNNIFAFSRTGEIARYREEDHISFLFERNIIYSTTGYLLLGGWRNGNFRMQGNLYWDTSTEDPDFDDMGFDEVTDEAAATGQRCLKLEDAPGLKYVSAFLTAAAIRLDVCVTFGHPLRDPLGERKQHGGPAKGSGFRELP